MVPKKNREFFFRYALPCTQAIIKNGRVSENYYNFIKANYKEKGIVPLGLELEDIYVSAFERLKRLSSVMGMDYWDFPVLFKYWRGGEHNRLIDCGEGVYGHTPEEFNDFCRIHFGKVFQSEKDILRVNYSRNKSRTVKNFFVPEAKIGDIVTIHFDYACENLSD